MPLNDSAVPKLSSNADPAVTVNYRDYRSEDFPRLHALDQECFPPGIAYSEAELMHYVRRRNAFTIVAESGQGLAGFIVAETQSTRGHVITLDVSPKHRRRAIGSELMLRAEEKMKGAGCRVVFLETAVNNAAALAFYHRFGYVVIKTIPRYYEGNLDALLMGKKLVSHPSSKVSERTSSK